MPSWTPWIKRCSFGIKFTDEVQTDDIEVNCSESEKNERKTENGTSEDEGSRVYNQIVEMPTGKISKKTLPKVTSLI